MGGPPVSRENLSDGPPRSLALGQSFATNGPPVSADYGDGPPSPTNTASFSQVSGGARFNFSQIAGTPTVLWDNTVTGDRRIWLTNGATVVSTTNFGPSPLDWRIIGAADFSRSGNPDIIWENYSTGQSGIWVMNGLNHVSWISFGATPLEWHIVGAADFSGDGTPDILWENTSTGAHGFWTMNGTNHVAWTVLGGPAPPPWRVVGAVDITGDGKADVIWENSNTGDSGFWTMNGSTIVGWTAFGRTPLDWDIVGAADFLGDGQNGIMWANRVTGASGFWRMTRGTVTGWSSFPAEPTDWKPRALYPTVEPIVPVASQALKAGGFQNCGLTAGGAAYCWGRALYGQVGNGTHPDIINAPVAVSGGLSFTQLAPGEDHSCAMTGAGAAYCWGQEGAFADANGDRLTPQLVPGGLTFTSLAAGQLHTCGLTNTGAAYCWGYNKYGSLGDGTKTDRPTPTLVSGGQTFASLAAGGLLTCGLTTVGDAYCWGANPIGAIGNGSTDTTSVLVPTAVTGGHKFVSLITGGLHTCGLTNLGVAWCWGQDADGELGDGSPTDSRPSPTLVSGGLTFASLTAGNYQTCGLTNAGVAYCWGLNDFGEIGDGTFGTPRTTPTPVSGGLSFGTLVAGFEHTCGLTFSGTAYCWGDNTNGQVGDGTTSTTVDRTTPTLVSGGLLFRNP